MLRAARDGVPVNVFGTDYETPDGTCIRDYVQVMDIADAHVLALEYLLDGGNSCALNLANARGYSVNEVIATAERVCSCTVPVRHAPCSARILVGTRRSNCGRLEPVQHKKPIIPNTRRRGHRCSTSVYF